MSSSVKSICIEPTGEGLGCDSVVEQLLRIHIIVYSIPSAIKSVSQSVSQLIPQPKGQACSARTKGQPAQLTTVC